MFQIASFKIICTDSTEIVFSKLRSAGFSCHLPKQSFSLFLTVRGGIYKALLVDFFSFSRLFINKSQCVLGAINAGRPIFYDCSGESLAEQLLSFLQGQTINAPFDIETCSGICFICTISSTMSLQLS